MSVVTAMSYNFSTFELKIDTNIELSATTRSLKIFCIVLIACFRGIGWWTGHATNCLYFCGLAPEWRPSNFLLAQPGENQFQRPLPPSPSPASVLRQNLWRCYALACRDSKFQTAASSIYVIARILLNKYRRLLISL